MICCLCCDCESQVHSTLFSSAWPQDSNGGASTGDTHVLLQTQRFILALRVLSVSYRPFILWNLPIVFGIPTGYYSLHRRVLRVLHPWLTLAKSYLVAFVLLKDSTEVVIDWWARCYDGGHPFYLKRKGGSHNMATRSALTTKIHHLIRIKDDGGKVYGLGAWPFIGGLGST